MKQCNKKNSEIEDNIKVELKKKEFEHKTTKYNTLFERIKTEQEKAVKDRQYRHEKRVL